MVMPIGMLRSGELGYVRDDIAAVVAAAGDGAIVKVILENAFLTDDEKVTGCRARRGSRGGVRQDVDRLCPDGRDARRPPPHAGDGLTCRQDQGRRRRANARRADRLPQRRHRSLRGDGYGRDHRRPPSPPGLLTCGGSVSISAARTSSRSSSRPTTTTAVVGSCHDRAPVAGDGPAAVVGRPGRRRARGDRPMGARRRMRRRRARHCSTPMPGRSSCSPTFRDRGGAQPMVGPLRVALGAAGVDHQRRQGVHAGRVPDRRRGRGRRRRRASCSEPASAAAWSSMAGCTSAAHGRAGELAHQIVVRRRPALRVWQPGLCRGAWRPPGASPRWPGSRRSRTCSVLRRRATAGGASDRDEWPTTSGVAIANMITCSCPSGW